MHNNQIGCVRNQNLSVPKEGFYLNFAIITIAFITEKNIIFKIVYIETSIMSLKERGIICLRIYIKLFVALFVSTDS